MRLYSGEYIGQCWEVTISTHVVSAEKLYLSRRNETTNIFIKYIYATYTLVYTYTPTKTGDCAQFLDKKIAMVMGQTFCRNYNNKKVPFFVIFQVLRRNFHEFVIERAQNPFAHWQIDCCKWNVCVCVGISWSDIYTYISIRRNATQIRIQIPTNTIDKKKHALCLHYIKMLFIQSSLCVIYIFFLLLSLCLFIFFCLLVLYTFL